MLKNKNILSRRIEAAPGQAVEDKAVEDSRLPDVLVVVVCLIGALSCLWFFQRDINKTLSRLNEAPIGTITFKYKAAQRRFADRVLWDRLQRDSPVYNGDLIRTADRSEATVTFAKDASIVDLAENSLIQLFTDRIIPRLDFTEGSISVAAASGGEGVFLTLGEDTVLVAAGSVVSATAMADGSFKLQVSEGSAAGTGAGGHWDAAAGEVRNLGGNSTTAQEPQVAVLSPRPAARLITTGTDDGPGTVPIEFSWSRINYRGSELTRIEVAEDRGFKRIIETRDVEYAAAAMTVELPARTLFWRVYPVHWTANAATGKLAISSVPPPRIITPAENAVYRYQLKPPEVRFQWTAAAEVSYYILEAADNPDFRNPALQTQGNAASLVYSKLGEGRWYWRVHPVFGGDYEGSIPASAVASFDIRHGEEFAVNRNDFEAVVEALSEAPEEAHSETITKQPDTSEGRETTAREIAEIAEAYYGAFAKQPDTPEGRDAAEDATDYARQSIEKDPSQALPHYILGKVSQDFRRMDTAIAELKEAVRLDPDNYIYTFDLGRAYFTNRDYSLARQSFEKTANLNRNLESAWYNLGGAFRAMRMLDEALTAYRRAVEVKPDYAIAYREIGRILSTKGDAKGAVDAFTKAIRYAPDDLASIRELGVAQMALNDFAAAEVSFAKALRLFPEDDQTNYNMAVVKINQNKGAEALAYAKKAAETAPSNALYAYTLGLATEADGNFEGAVAAYNRAIFLDAAYIRPRINLGSLYLSNKQWDQSVEHYEKALQSEPANATVWINLARALAGSGDLSKARDAYLECLTRDPANGDARLELGKTYVGLGDPDSAKQSLRELIKGNPNYPGNAEAERILAELSED